MFVVHSAQCTHISTVFVWPSTWIVCAWNSLSLHSQLSHAYMSIEHGVDREVFGCRVQTVLIEEPKYAVMLACFRSVGVISAFLVTGTIRAVSNDVTSLRGLGTTIWWPYFGSSFIDPGFLVDRCILNASFTFDRIEWKNNQTSFGRLRTFEGLMKGFSKRLINTIRYSPSLQLDADYSRCMFHLWLASLSTYGPVNANCVPFRIPSSLLAQRCALRAKRICEKSKMTTWHSIPLRIACTRCNFSWERRACGICATNAWNDLHCSIFVTSFPQSSQPHKWKIEIIYVKMTEKQINSLADTCSEPTPNQSNAKRKSAMRLCDDSSKWISKQ